MGQLCSIKSGKSDTQDAVPDGEYAFFDRSRIVKRSSRYLYDCEALIMPGEGAEFLPKHFTGRFDLHQRAYALFDFAAGIDVRYLYYYLHYAKDYFPRVAVGATVKSLRLRHFEQLPIVVAPLREQRRIVAILDEAFKGIQVAAANLERCARNAGEVFSRQLDGVFAGEVEAWPNRTLGELFDITSSRRVFQSEWKQVGVPFYRAREIVRLAKHGFVNNELFISEAMFEEYSKRYGAPNEGDIMVTGVGTLGICYVVGEGDRFYFKDGNIIWLKRRSDVDSRFVEYAFQSQVLRQQIDDSVGATVGTYTIVKAKSTRIPVPSPAEQRRIVGTLDDLRRETRHLESVFRRKINELDALKQSLLNEAYSGDL